MKIKLFLISLTLLTATAGEVKAESFLFGQNEPTHITVNNRVLAKIHGKPISVIDVMKKMDVMFYRQFPEYSTSPQARYQFYMANWKHVLDDLIDKELILADAEELKIPISTGDVRQEMENLFGPNIITNLDKIGLTYEEANNMVKGDITLRRMLMYRANSKALRQITPQVVREAYDKMAKDNIREDQWRYYVISIRGADGVADDKAAKAVHDMLTKDSVPLDQLATKAKENAAITGATTVTVSQELIHNDKEVSDAYKEILSKLQPDAYSDPIAQKSRADSSTVYRIFNLKKMTKGGIIPFAEVENRLRDKLLDITISKETEAYLKRLREHFDVQDSHLKDMIADDFEPFSLK